MRETLITRDGLSRLTGELERLRTAGRTEMARRIQDAVRKESNPGENPDYHDAREEQALLERRIAVLEERIASAEVADPDGSNGVVDIGERVRLRDLESGEQVEYELVGSLEADPVAGRISAAAPLGRALLGRGPGDVAEFEAPRGLQRFEILAIEDAGAVGAAAAG